MRKLFFASALVAGMGMLGSCSNDDVAVTNGTPGRKWQRTGAGRTGSERPLRNG